MIRIERDDPDYILSLLMKVTLKHVLMRVVSERSDKKQGRSVTALY